MSFDIFAQAFQDGDAGLADLAAARTVILNERHKHDPRFDQYFVELADCSQLEMYAGGLDRKKPFQGAMFALRDINEAVGDFIFRFSRAAGCVLLPTGQSPCVLLTEEGQSRHLPADLTKNMQVITVSSGAELLAAVEGGYNAWRAYRDKCVGGGS